MDDAEGRSVAADGAESARYARSNYLIYLAAIAGSAVASILGNIVDAGGGLPTICKEGSRTHEYACCVG